MKRSAASEWHEMFKKGREDVKDGARCGRLKIHPRCDN